MDFEILFDRIGLAEIGREQFWLLHKRRGDTAFAASLAESDRAFEEGDAAFGGYIAEFARREQIEAEVLNLYIYLTMCGESYEAYRKKGMDPDIFYATMQDIAKLSQDHFVKTGIYGIPQKIYRRWLRRYLACTIFRIGRLQFDIAASIYDTEIDGIPVSKGDTVISVHIPGGARLEEEACEASYAAAREFFKKHYDMPRPVFFCYSWLIQPWLSEVLPKDSLISRFQGKYKIIDFVDDPGDMLMWVFPKACESIEDYPEDTTLQRLTKERLRRGEIIGYGAGVRL